MKKDPHDVHSHPPPLIPQSVRGWIAPLARAALAALLVSSCYAFDVFLREGHGLADSLQR